MDNKNQQQPIEIVLDSVLGSTQNSIDGHKIFKLNNSLPVDFGNGFLKKGFFSNLLSSNLFIAPFAAIAPLISKGLLRNLLQ